MAIQFTGSLDVLGSINTLGTAVSSLGSSDITGSLSLTGSMELAYQSGSTTTEPGAWSTGGALITARDTLGGAGTQTAGLAFGGYSPSYGRVSCTEEYDGTSWTAGGALITARFLLAGAGTQNAALAFGGLTPATVTCTEEYTATSTTTYTTAPTINYDKDNGALILSQVLTTSYADDTAAAAGGVPVGGLYRTGGAINIRLT